LSLEVCKISFAWGQIPAPLHSLHKVGLTCAIAVSPTLFRQTLSVSSLSQRAPLSLGPQAILSHNSLVKTVEVPRPPLFGEKKKLYLMHTGTSGLTSGGGLQAWNGAVVKRSQRYLKSYFFCSESALFVYRVCLCSQHRIFFFWFLCSTHCMMCIMFCENFNFGHPYLKESLPSSSKSYSATLYHCLETECHHLWISILRAKEKRARGLQMTRWTTLEGHHHCIKMLQVEAQNSLIDFDYP
jgi:hypothetical protein